MTRGERQRLFVLYWSIDPARMVEQMREAFIRFEAPLTEDERAHPNRSRFINFFLPAADRHVSDGLESKFWAEAERALS